MSDRKVVFGWIVVAAIFALFATGCGSGSGAESANTNTQPTIVDVTTAQAVVLPIPAYIEATGNLASDAQSDVAPAVSGKIVEVNFDVGSYVTQGSILIRLDPRDAQIRLEQSRAQLDQQKRAVAQAQANVDQAVANLRQTQARLGVVDGQNFQIRDFSQVKSV
ncbi:MAG TPA: biotin/lipoyl-binding protein, partial [Pyrinomonadaceae bacterium]|nr:biotin/lipoyl-binding protein [Pyrinomonadaceae bacterium]